MNNQKLLRLVCNFFGAGLFFLISLCCTNLAVARDLTLGWDPNSEADLAGYGVYFRKDVPGPPYNLSGYVTVAELSNPSSPVFTVAGLENGARYYFAVTAYDSSENESAFSNSVCAEIGNVIALCSSSSGGGGGGGSGGVGGGAGSGGSTSSGSSGSGGGGQCFIETVAADGGRWNAGISAVAILGCILAGMKYVSKRHSRRLLP